MIEVKYIPPTYGDCMAEYSVTLDKEYSIYDFINTILEERSGEWGSFIVNTDGNRLECEYRSGGIVKQEIPKEVLKRSIESVKGHGGYTCMNYYIEVSEVREEKVFNIVGEVATDEATAKMLDITTAPVVNVVDEDGKVKYVNLIRQPSVSANPIKWSGVLNDLKENLEIKNVLLPPSNGDLDADLLLSSGKLGLVGHDDEPRISYSTKRATSFNPICNKCGAKNLSTGKCSNFNCERNK